MFHNKTDASKVALVALVDRLNNGGATLLDVQWSTDHLESLGAIEIPRTKYFDNNSRSDEGPSADVAQAKA